MGKFIDLTGQRFGMWTVLSRAANNARNEAMWNVRCDCGTERTVVQNSLCSGKSKSCGCAVWNNLVGKRFGKLLVVEKSTQRVGNRISFLCKCDCGREKIVSGHNLTQGNVSSCGCYLKESRQKHRLYGCRIYHIWAAMVQRCTNPKSISYPNYGARGIAVCDEWRNDFQAFYDWAMANGYSDDLTIDRIDNNKDYSPDNCRWADMKTQANNTRRNSYFDYRGERLTMAELCRKYHINHSTLWSRLQSGMSISEAIEKPIRKY